MPTDRPQVPGAGNRPGPRRGWLLVATLAASETTSYGVLAYAFAVFLLPMQQELGWSRTTLTGAYSAAVIVSGVAAFPVGRWLDRHGARALMTTGSVAAVLLVLAWAHVSDLIAFYAIWSGIGLTMAAVLYEPAFVVIATWFRNAAARTRALLALTVIAGFASVIYVPLAGWLVQARGWRHALIVLAVLLVPLTVVPNATLPGRRPTQLELPADPEALATSEAADRLAVVPLRDALRDQTLWWLTAAFVAATLATTTITVHLVTYLREQHYSAGLAATWTGLIGAGSVGGRILVTALGRRWPLATATTVVFAVQALAVAILLSLPGQAGVAAFVILFGLGAGLVSLTRAALVADVYGLHAYASINGVLALPLTIARAGAPVAAAALRTATGTYQLVFVAVALCSMIASATLGRAHQLHRQASWSPDR
jgi:MFS family permease